MWAFCKKQSDKNSATSAVAGFVDVINDAIFAPAGAKRHNEKDTLSGANSPLQQNFHRQGIEWTQSGLNYVGVAELIAQKMN